MSPSATKEASVTFNRVAKQEAEVRTGGVRRPHMGPRGEAGQGSAATQCRHRRWCLAGPSSPTDAPGGVTTLPHRTTTFIIGV